MKQIIRTFTSLLPIAMVVAARADYQLDINGGANNYVNSDINTYTGGSNYPGGGSSFSIGGVDFSTATINGTDMGVVLTDPGEQVYDYAGLNVAVGGSDSLYTLINSGDGGAAGTYEGMIEVFGTGGAYTSLSLTEGQNIRDHFNGFYCNTITDPTVVSGYFTGGIPSSDPNSSNDRLDRQELILGSSFDGQSVTEIKFTFEGHGFPDGSPFLAAATLSPSSAPEPFSTSLLIGGLFAIVRRRRLRS